MKETGQLLKTRRIEKDLSLKQVSEALKISVRVLQAIEDNDAKRLPPRVFLRGFVQSYAQYLQSDVDLILETFHKEEEESIAALRPAPPPTPVDSESEKKPEPKHSKPSPAPPPPQASKPQKAKARKQKRAVWAVDYRKWSFATKAFAFLVVAILVTLIVFVTQMVEKYERESTVRVEEDISAPPLAHEETGRDAPMSSMTIESDTSENPTAAETQDSLPVVPPTPENAAAAPSAEEPPAQVIAPKPPAPAPVVEKPADPKPEESPASPPVAPTPEAPAPQAADSGTTEETDDSPEAAAQPSAEPPPVSTGTQEVIIEAFDEVVLKYQLDKEAPTQITLGPGDLHTLKADSKIKVQVSNGGVINVFYNGTDRGVPGKIGEKINLTYP